MFKLSTIARAAGATVAVAGATAANAVSTLPSGVASGIADAQSAGVEVIGLLSAAGAAVWLLSKVLRKFGVLM